MSKSAETTKTKNLSFGTAAAIGTVIGVGIAASIRWSSMFIDELSAARSLHEFWWILSDLFRHALNSVPPLGDYRPLTTYVIRDLMMSRAAIWELFAFCCAVHLLFLARKRIGPSTSAIRTPNAHLGEQSATARVDSLRI
jgi:hypothetical protein